MSTFVLPRAVTVFPGGDGQSRCFQYAVQECVRLLRKMGVEVETRAPTERPDSFSIGLGLYSAAESTGALPAHDGFTISVSKDGVGVVAATAKGVLNGVYHLAERFGVVFLLPGESGEWAPERVRSLPSGETVMQPRFPHRGVFWESLSTQDYSVEEWLRFYAKLKFNALSHAITDLPLAEELGIRLETGGHGLANLLPRELFATAPHLFRMFQPEDFRGQRVKDSNFCITHPEARNLVKKAFAQELKSATGVYGIHAWADDLPAGGWCLCPSCRAFSPADQSMLAMNLLAEAAKECESPARIATIAYHDTMFPGANIAPDERCFLLFAPRERCYGHALNDPQCARNRHYLEALDAWKERCRAVPDSHTFEYYFDQILFRGMYPFLPDVILADMATYAAYGISTHLSLQVAGPALAPEFNMLIFAAAHWDDRLTTVDFCSRLAEKLAEGGVPAWADYLQARAAVFADAMRMCGHDLLVYLDYRWLPETTAGFGREMAGVYADASRRLRDAADRLAAATGSHMPERLAKVMQKEIERAGFEAEELMVMHYQQCAVNHFAEYLNTGARGAAGEGCRQMTQAISALDAARAKALAFGLSEQSWYCRNINAWLAGEFERKIERYGRVCP
jgi:hypothetical protein